MLRARILAYIWLLVSPSVLAVVLNLRPETQYSPCKVEEGTVAPEVRCDAAQWLASTRLRLHGPRLAVLHLDNVVSLPSRFMDCSSTSPSATLSQLQVRFSLAAPSVLEPAPDALLLCSGLVSLSLSDSRPRLLQGLSTLVGAVPGLRSLEVAGANLSRQLGPGSLANNSGFLRSVSLARISGLQDGLSPTLFGRHITLDLLAITHSLLPSSLFSSPLWDHESTFSATTIKLDGCTSLNRLPRPLSRRVSADLRRLSLKQTGLTALSLSDTESLFALQHLNLAGTSISSNNTPGLAGLSSLLSLYLTGIDSLLDLPPSLSSLTQLQLLKINSLSNLRFISPRLPASLTSLDVSHLSDQITASASSSAAFSQLRHLNFLDISAVASLIFLQDLPSCQQLLTTNSSNNTAAAATVVGPGAPLQNLYIRDLKASVHSSELFSFISRFADKLVNLHLDKNSLSILPPDAVLDAMQRLRQLSLAGNSLSTLDSDGFQRLATRLTKLDLSRNRLSWLSPCVLWSLLARQVPLSIADNPLQPLSEGDCSNCRSPWWLSRANHTSSSRSLLCPLCTPVCLPASTGIHYPINFTVETVPASNHSLLVHGLALSSPAFAAMFDHLQLIIRQHPPLTKRLVVGPVLQLSRVLPVSVSVSWPSSITTADPVQLCVLLESGSSHIVYEESSNCRSVRLLGPPRPGSSVVVVVAGVVSSVVLTAGLALTIALVLARRRRHHSRAHRSQPPAPRPDSVYSEPNDQYEAYCTQSDDQQYLGVDEGPHTLQSDLWVSGQLLPSPPPLPSQTAGAMELSFLSSTYSGPGRTNRFLKKKNNNLTTRQRTQSACSVAAMAVASSLSLHVPPNDPNRQLPAPPKPRYPSLDLGIIICNADRHLDYFSHPSSRSSRSSRLSRSSRSSSSSRSPTLFNHNTTIV